MALIMDKWLERLVKVFLILTSVVVVIVLILTFLNYFMNNSIFSSNINQLLSTLINGLTPTNDIQIDDEFLHISIKYLERVGDMHRQASNTELFVLLYGFLSSVLIGVSAYLVKKGQENLKELASTHEKLSGKYGTLKNGYINLYGMAKDISGKLDNNQNYMHFSFVSQVLTDALLMISCYENIVGTNQEKKSKNDYIVKFTTSIHQVAQWCKNVDFSKVDKLGRDKFGQRFGYVESTYNKVIKNSTTLTSERHKKIILEYFNLIRTSLGQIEQ
jgi:hypothetical protein